MKLKLAIHGTLLSVLIVVSGCTTAQTIRPGALLHYDGLYYVVGSELTGWRANPNVYTTAKSLAGPWSEFPCLAAGETK